MNNLQFTKTIKALCEKNKVSIAKMLSDCNLPKSFIYDVEKRNTAPSIEKLEKIATFFGVTVDYLVGNDTNISAPIVEKDEIIFNRNGEVIKKKFTKEQMDYLEKFIRSISNDESEL